MTIAHESPFAGARAEEAIVLYSPDGTKYIIPGSEMSQYESGHVPPSTIPTAETFDDTEEIIPISAFHAAASRESKVSFFFLSR